jgi:hypothetical protein
MGARRLTDRFQFLFLFLILLLVVSSVFANQRFPDANKNAAHDECAALPTEIDLLAKMRCWLDEVRTFFMNNPVWE